MASKGKLVVQWWEAKTKFVFGRHQADHICKLAIFMMFALGNKSVQM
jgi:hypothetical protein